MSLVAAVVGGCRTAPPDSHEQLADAIAIVEYEKARLAANLGLDLDAGHRIGEAHVDKSGATFAIACEADTDLSRAYQVAFDDALHAVEKAVGRTLEPVELRRDAREHFTDGGEGVACSRVSAGPFHVESNGVYPADPAMAPVRRQVPRDAGDAGDVGDAPEDPEEHFTYENVNGAHGRLAAPAPSGEPRVKCNDHHIDHDESTAAPNGEPATKPAAGEPRDPGMDPLYDVVPYNPRNAGGINGSASGWQQ